MQVYGLITNGELLIEGAWELVTGFVRIQLDHTLRLNYHDASYICSLE